MKTYFLLKSLFFALLFALVGLWQVVKKACNKLSFKYLKYEFYRLQALFLVLTFTLWSSLGLTSCGFVNRITNPSNIVRADFTKLLQGDTVSLKKKTLWLMALLRTAR